MFATGDYNPCHLDQIEGPAPVAAGRGLGQTETQESRPDVTDDTPARPDAVPPTLLERLERLEEACDRLEAKADELRALVDQRKAAE